MDLIPLEDIIVGERARQIIELNVEKLMTGISEGGLLHPILVKDNGDGSFNLVAGGHRLEAYTRLALEDPDTYGEIPCTDIEESFREQNKLGDSEYLSDADLLKYEIEENVKRAGMTWQDKTLGLARYHKISMSDARKSGDSWTQSMTGELLGLDQSNVSRALLVAKRLSASKLDPIWKEESLMNALRVLVKEKQEQAAEIQLERLKAKRAEISAKAFFDPDKVKPASVADLLGVDLTGPTSATEAASGMGLDFSGPVKTSLPSMDEAARTIFPNSEPSVVEEKYSHADLAGLYWEGDALAALPELAKTQTIHHIVTDPPYAIEMSNLEDQKNIDSVAETHKVPENLVLIKDFLQVAYDCIDEKGFLCMWYDVEHHEKIRDWAKKIGWKVCRWPFVWCKTSPCSNQAASYNFTKSTENCMVFRRSEASVLVEKQSCNFVLSPGLSNAPHPFMKPMPVWERLINAVSYEGQTIVDPFAGAGSSLYAGTVIGRNMVGVELDPKHISTGINWLHSNLNVMDILGESVI